MKFDPTAPLLSLWLVPCFQVRASASAAPRRGSVSDAEAKWIMLALRINPHLAMERDARGHFPIHDAARLASRSGGKIVRALLSAFPAAAQAKDSSGWLPLQIVTACMSGTEGAETLQALLRVHPTAAMARDGQGRLPLHLVCTISKRSSMQMVRLLLSAYPGALFETRIDGMTLLEAAKESRCLPKNTFALLCKAHAGKSDGDVEGR